MDFYFTDRKFNLLGVASTSGSTDISLANEEDRLSIEDSVRTLTGSLFYGPESRKQAEAMSSLGNYVLYKDESGRSVWTTVMEINNDPLAGECVFLAEDAGVDLINELVGPYMADKAYPIASYISRFTADSGFKIGVNEISNLSRKLEWESEESTALARILSVATQFDNAELEFRFEVNGLQVVERYIDIFKKRGKDERVTLYVDKDINRITTSGNLYELGTSLYGIGGTPEGKDNPITLKGYKYTDPEGRYVLGSDGIMRDTVAVQKWSRLLSNDNPTPTSSHIQRRKTYETTDQKTLCDNVLRDLKQMAEVELNYEAEIVSLPYGVKIGDTIYLVDEEGGLYLSARVLELVRCYSEDRYLATLGNYLIKDSGIDVDLQALADKLKDQVKPGDTYYPWTRYADDDQGNGMSALPDGKTYMATIHRKNDPIPSDNKDDYAEAWVKIKGDDGTDGEPGKDGEKGDKGDPGSDGLPGKDGVGLVSTQIMYAGSDSGTVKPTTGWTANVPVLAAGKYLWTETTWLYSDNTGEAGYSVSRIGKDGNTGNDGVAGKDGVGIKSTAITYVKSTSGTTKPTSGWTTSIPTVPAGEYLWTKTVWTYTDNTTETGYSVAKMGDTGADAINGTGQLVFNNRYERWPVSTNVGDNLAGCGWGYSSNFTMIDPETDKPYHRIAQSKSRASTNVNFWSTGIPVSPGTTIKISGDIKSNAIPDWASINYFLSRFFPAGTPDTTTDVTAGSFPGYNTTVYISPKGNLTKNVNMTANAIKAPVITTADTWYTFEYEVVVPDDAGILKICHTADWITPMQQFSYRDLNAIAYKKGDTGPQGPQGPKGDPGSDGSNGKDGDDALPIFSGYVTNEAIILSATNSGAVSDFSKATGTFVTYLGQDQLTSGVTYSRVSQSGVTATINTTTGAYSVTAASADSGMVVFKAVYQGIEIQKIVSVTKAKQGNTGETGPQGDGSYLHTAWKMADGTFTVSYPQENMFSRSDGQKYTGHPLNASMPVVAIASETGMQYTASCNYEYASSVSNTWFTNTLEVLPSSTTHSIGIMNGTPTSRTFSALGSQVYLVFRNAGALSYFINSPWKSIIKVEQGDTATLITPSPKDDYTLAYPKYRGEYTDTIAADSTDPTKYTWTAYLGEQGPPTGVISQNTVPSSPYVGMLWQCTGNIAGYINPATYRWNGSAWEIYQFTAQNIMADTFTGFVFRGVEFIGSKFVSEFDIPIGTETGAHAVGQTVIENGGMVTDMVEYLTAGDYDKHLEFSPNKGILMTYKGRQTSDTQEAQLTPEGLRIKTPVAEAILSVATIYSLVNPARNNTAPPDDANRKGVVVNYFRVGNLVNVAIKFELLKDTGWVALAPSPPSGYYPTSMYQASGVAGSISFRGQTCMVYCNPDGLRLIPTTGQGTGVFQLSLTWTTNDPFPYGDS